MTKIYMVRHCEALGNVLQVFQGTSDLDITELGEKQLEFLTKRFEDIELDRVFSSPLIRTQKTAKAIIGNKNLPIEICNGLIELDGGIIEGKPFLESCKKYPEIGYAWTHKPEAFAPEGGEKMVDAYERIWNAVKTLALENKGKTIACATHGGVTRCLMCRLIYGDITRLKDMPYFDNTAISLIEFDDDLNPKLLFYNNTEHLPEGLININSKTISKVEDE